MTMLTLSLLGAAAAMIAAWKNTSVGGNKKEECKESGDQRGTSRQEQKVCEPHGWRFRQPCACRSL